MHGPELIGDYLKSPVGPEGFAKIASDFNRVDWRPFSPEDAPGWREGGMPLSDNIVRHLSAFGSRRREFYGTFCRLRALGGIFQHQELLADFIHFEGHSVSVAEPLLRAAAVCKVVNCNGCPSFDPQDLLACTRHLADVAAVKFEGGVTA